MAQMRRLILFDVDGTLIARGDPAHLAAIDAGILASFPNIEVSIQDIEFDGKVDRQIVRELVRSSGISGDLDLARLQFILDSAAEAYRRSWEGRSGADDLLPGVRDVIERLATDQRFALGVLTGGVQGVVETKLKRLGLAEFFPIGSFGDEVERRMELLPLALDRAQRHYNTNFDAGFVVVVGDTPNDVAAAHAGDVACLAVATGRFSVDELAAAGAERVLPDLSDTGKVIAELCSIERCGSRP